MMIRGADPTPLPAISGFDIFVGIVGAIFVALFVMQTLIIGRRLAKSDANRPG
jgi:hypothetical protein